MLNSFKNFLFSFWRPKKSRGMNLICVVLLPLLVKKIRIVNTCDTASLAEGNVFGLHLPLMVS